MGIRLGIPIPAFVAVSLWRYRRGRVTLGEKRALLVSRAYSASVAPAL